MTIRPVRGIERGQVHVRDRVNHKPRQMIGRQPIPHIRRQQNPLAALQQHARGQSGNVRHIPRAVLRAAAPFSRQARAALAIDTIDMTSTRTAHNQATNR